MSEYTQNPFASTHSLDTNPFDDPATPSRTNAEANRLAALQQRERDLERREAELTQQQANIKSHGKANWPFFMPLIYHSIKEEIPEASRPLMTRLYQLWLVLIGTMILNLVACVFILTSGSNDGARDMGGAIGYFVLIIPASFLLWYRPIYNGYMKEQALYYYMYFFFGGFHLLFSAYMLIGVPSTGSAGIINTISMFARKAFVAGVLGLLATIGWAIQGLGNAYYYRQIWQHHNAAGHSMEKAKGELASHGAKSYFMRG